MSTQWLSHTIKTILLAADILDIRELTLISKPGQSGQKDGGSGYREICEEEY
jgi:hypothetical protein